MNIVEFQNRMVDIKNYTDDERNYIFKVSASNNPDLKSMIVMEECAELQEVLYSIFSGADPDNGRTHLLEELADVSIGLEYLRIIYNTPDYKGEDHKPKGKRNNQLRATDILWIMKELSILQQCVSKCVRNYDDSTYNLHRRMKYVYSRIRSVQHYYHISDVKLQNAIDVKLQRTVFRENINFKKEI